MKRNEHKTVKAWVVLDTETGELARYDTGTGEYMIGPRKTPKSGLHHTFKEIPCTITYELP